MLADALSAALIGLISAGHCLGMCGGLTVALGFHSHGHSTLVAYNLGRIVTYALLGLLVGFGLSWLPQAAIPALRLLAAVLLILIALYYLNIAAWITRLEQLALPLWRRLQPLTRAWLPARRPGQAFRVGLVWGFLPCGLVYTALGYAAAQASPVRSGIMMLAFGAGTLPAMVATGALSQRLNRGLTLPWVRRLIGLTLLFFAVWLSVQAFRMI